MMWGRPKVVALHVGTHKTGTTSLQAMVARHQQHFDDQGLYYPKRGRVGDGHHNVAWELNGDDRYDPTRGSLVDLVVELEKSQPRGVLLSSEDFEYLYRRPEELEKLRSELAMLGYRARVVVALREPTEYLESLYAELIKHGLDKDVRTFVTEALAEGGVIFHNWDFRLDYEQLVAGFAAVFGARSVHVVPYDRVDSVGPVLASCGDALRLRVSPIAGWQRFNVRSEPSGVEGVLTPGSAVAQHGDARSSVGRLTPPERAAVEATYGGVVAALVRRFPASRP
jgi:hypothetical protein